MGWSAPWGEVEKVESKSSEEDYLLASWSSGDPWSFSKVWFLNFLLLPDGFALVTHQAAKLYFILFHIVVVILIVKRVSASRVGNFGSPFSAHLRDRPSSLVPPWCRLGGWHLPNGC